MEGSASHCGDIGAEREDSIQIIGITEELQDVWGCVRIAWILLEEGMLWGRHTHAHRIE